MRTIKFVLLAIFATSMGVACSDDKDSTEKAVQEEEMRRKVALENVLLGQWMEASPKEDGCVISFMDGELIFNRNIYGGFNDTLSCTYQVISGELVQIAIGDKSAGYKVVVYNSDNIVIKDFIPSDAAVYPPLYTDIALKRLSPVGEDNAKVCEWTHLTPISVENQLKIVLDEVFSAKNDLVKNIKSDTLFVINNEQELRNVSKNINTVINMNFDRQSIVWGKIFVSSISDVIRAKDLYMCIQSSDYKYEISMEKCIDCWAATGYLYFWEIYSQKIDTKNTSLIIN
ncbi:MAG: hypothetical protein LBL79_13455 [Prevotella sp.]|jgi:hypothetical protein|nr:hypothetical protein [Prevotella sp.]